MSREERGFASMDPEKQRAIAAKGGRTAQAKGTAHRWTAEEARVAGRKGGSAKHRNRREAAIQAAGPAPSPAPASASAEEPAA